MALGLWGPVSHLIAPAGAAIPQAAAPQQPVAAVEPPVVLQAPHAGAKKQRPVAASLTGALPTGKVRSTLADDAQPLSPDAFTRRFPRHVSLTGNFASRFVAAKLLERPDTIDPRSTFALAKADALADAAVLHPARPATLAPAAQAAADMPRRGPLAETAAPAESAPVVLASLGNTDFEVPPLLGLPDSVDAPDLRPVGVAKPPVTPKTAVAPKALTAPEKPAGRAKDQETARPSRLGKLLAFARPDEPVEDEPAPRARIPWPGSSKRTAIYDISAGVVHMPNGDRLEAHSGRGRMRDNPRFVHVKMHGPTPPSTYRLTMREARFHGVEAIRLTPIDGKAPHGRVGLLAHTYLLRNAPPGDSSGCVAFKNYDRFLKAFKRGEVDQMVVVASMSSMPVAAARSRVASLFSRGR